MKNYFKTHNGHLFFFHDSVPESVESAYRTALLLDENPSVFRPARFAGPWDACPVIGHRRREEILQDLSSETDEEELSRLVDELTAFDSTFIDVGRQVPQQVAA